VIYFFTAATIALAYYVGTIAIFDLSGGNVFISTIVNTALILFFVAESKADGYIYKKLKARAEKKKPSFLMKMLMKSCSDSVCTKSGLYLFYIFVLINMALTQANPNFPHLLHSYEYTQTVYYGLLILVAADEFVAQLFKDMSSERAE
jgi:hypothetical protein